MMPRSARRLRVSMAIAGVGIGPTSTTSMPMEIKPGGQRRLQHVAGQARVLADHRQMPVVAAMELDRRGHGDPQGGFGGHRLDIGGAADAVGTKQFSRHDPSRTIAVF